MDNPAIVNMDTFGNYYESLVLEEIGVRQLHQQDDDATVLDIVCMALNQLPAKYIRHPTNVNFYSSQPAIDAPGV